MKVSELINKLKQFDKDFEVLFINEKINSRKTREIIDLELKYHPCSTTQVPIVSLEMRKIK